MTPIAIECNRKSPSTADCHRVPPTAAYCRRVRPTPRQLPPPPLKQDGAKSAEGDGDDAGTAEARRRLKSRSRWREAFAKLKRAKSNLSGLGPLRVSKQIEGMGVLVAESYADCSILFAKLEGLELLVNNDERAPVEVVTLLQVGVATGRVPLHGPGGTR